MTLKTLNTILKAMDAIEKAELYLFCLILTIILTPFAAIYTGIRYIYRRLRGKVYDSDAKKWKTKKEIEQERLEKRIRNREVPLAVKKHKTPKEGDRFMFFEKRKLVIPYDQLVYVETEYNEAMHSFLSTEKEWLDTFQKWHGFDIVDYNYEDIREGMFYPQDFSVFKHGFLWRSNENSWDKESHIYGDIHYYYEIDPDSDIPIKDQMKSMMSKIYQVLGRYI